MRPLKILHVSGTSEGAAWLIEIARMLKNDGHSITVVCPRSEGSLYVALKKECIRAVVIPLDLSTSKDIPKVFIGSLKLLVFLYRERFDIIQYYLFVTTLICRIVGWLACVPIRISMCTGPYQLESKTMRILDKLTVFMDSEILASCEKIKKLYIGMGVKASKIIVVHCGMDIGRFDPEIDRNIVRSEYGFKPETPVIGIIAYFYVPRMGWLKGRSVKGHEFFLDAVPRVLKVFPNAKFLIVGDEWKGNGSYKKKLEDQASMLGIEKSIIFTGKRKDIPEILAALDISVQASLSESIGGAAESLLMACPTITTNVGGFPDVVKDHETGLLVPPADPEALAKAIVYFLKNGQEAKKMALAGRELVKKLFDIKITTRKIEEVYFTLASSKKIKV